MRYKSGYKYRLEREYVHRMEVPELMEPSDPPDIEYLNLDTSVLVIHEGYCWDGPSGPTADTRNFMRGSLVHDALYQLMRHGYLPQEFRKTADKELFHICIEDGMSVIRAGLVYMAVRLFGRKSASSESIRKIKHAPG